MVVAVFGIITTFLVLIMERERELALLQAIGASRRQILGMVLVESGLASFLSFILGAACGSVLSLLLILVINKQAFGWTIHLYLDPGHLLADPGPGPGPGPGRRGLPGLAGHAAAPGGDFERGIILVEQASSLFRHRQDACATIGCGRRQDHPKDDRILVE